MKNKIEVREMSSHDIGHIVDYFHDANPDFLRGMGADKARLPHRETMIESLEQELSKTYKTKNVYYVIWFVNEKSIGHSNINHIEFGETAKIHIHIWNKKDRRKGLGEQFIVKSLPFYFQNFELNYLLAEPYAQNPAPNNILSRLGFEFVKSYETIPSMICFTQTVNQYILTKTNFIKRYNNETV